MHSQPISAVVLETPFCSIRSMLTALYPQRWLPYRRLWPFLWNHWDSKTALRTLGMSLKPPKVLLLSGGRDEVVPASEADELELLCSELGLNIMRVNVQQALHNEVSLLAVKRRTDIVLIETS